MLTRSNSTDPDDVAVYGLPVLHLLGKRIEEGFLHDNPSFRSALFE
jgi:hypothetical protein